MNISSLTLSYLTKLHFRAPEKVWKTDVIYAGYDSVNLTIHHLPQEKIQFVTAWFQLKINYMELNDQVSIKICLAINLPKVKILTVVSLEKRPIWQRLVSIIFL